MAGVAALAESICPGTGTLLEHGEILTKQAEDKLRARWER